MRHINKRHHLFDFKNNNFPLPTDNIMYRYVGHKAVTKHKQTKHGRMDTETSLVFLSISLFLSCLSTSTVGYGDMVPETWQGKIIASFCALLGISFFALPAVSCGSRVIFKNSNTHPGAYKKLFKTSTRRVYYGGEELAY